MKKIAFTDEETLDDLEQVERLSKDLRLAAKTLTSQEARYYVDMYYIVQDDRKAVKSQIDTMNKTNEPHLLLDYLFAQLQLIEGQIKGALKIYVENQAVGEWCTSIIGIGPIITAGLLAHIDITKCPTAGHIMSFAGVAPGIKWQKSQRRPWNARLKVLVYLIGKSFVKTSNNPADYYGQIYKARKIYEEMKNERGDYADQAAAKLVNYKMKDGTKAKEFYLAGKLPPGHIQQRCERYAAKMFLYHLHHVMYVTHYGCLPPLPYVQERMGHVHITEPPNFDLDKYVTPELERQFRLRKKYPDHTSLEIVEAMKYQLGEELVFEPRKEIESSEESELQVKPKRGRKKKETILTDSNM